MLATVRLASSVSDGDQVEHLAGPLEVALEDRERPSRQVRGCSSSRAPSSRRSLARVAGATATIAGAGVAAGSSAPSGRSSAIWPESTISRTASQQVAAVEPRHPRRRAGSRAHPGATGRRSSSGRARRRPAGPRWPAGPARGRGSPASRTATARRRRCTGCPRRAGGRRSPRGACACGTGWRRPTSAGCVAQARRGWRRRWRPPRPPARRRRRSSTGGAVLALRPQALVRLEADRVAPDEAVGGGQHVLDASGSSARCAGAAAARARGRPGRGRAAARSAGRTRRRRRSWRRGSGRSTGRRRPRP